MENPETEHAWREIQNKVDELLRQSLAGNFFYRMEYGPRRAADAQDGEGDDREENSAEKA